LSLVIQKMLLSLSILCCKTLKSQCRHTKGISNQFRKIEFWLIPPKQPVDITISGNGLRNPQARYIWRR